MNSLELSTALSFGLERARGLFENKKILVLTGAGVSTDSGIPDYRGEGRVKRHPLTFDQFMGSRENQARYWSRSFFGWHQISQAKPNQTHKALAQAEQQGQVFQIITQNVDGLHQKAGSSKVIELHGRLDRVLCSQCGDILARTELNARMESLNPQLRIDVAVEFAPDGDADVEISKDFRVPECGLCGGSYKPDVVFFGEQVPKDRVLACEEAVSQAQALLVAGTSLTVNSGLRLVKLAKKKEIPVVIVNFGETKGDSLADVRLNAKTSLMLPRLFE